MSNLTIQSTTIKLVVNSTNQKVLEIHKGTRGLQGADGADGAGGSDVLEITSGEVLGGFRAVTWGGLYVDQTNLDEYAGVTLSAVSSGESVNIRRTGILTDVSFSFSAGQPVYSLATGVLVQAYTVLPIRRIGIAKTTTSIYLDPHPTIGA